MGKRELDWAGWWFARLREDGESTDIRFGRLAPGEGEPEWLLLPHEKHDGIGGFARILEERGQGMARLPSLKERDRPSRGARLLGAMRFGRRRPARTAAWRGLSAAKVRLLRSHRRFHPPVEPTAVAWHVFGREETRGLLASAKAQGVSLNSLLLWSLARACEDGLEPGSGTMDWMVPVNLRGGVERGDRFANHSAFITVSVSPGADPAQLHRQIKVLLRAGAHWAIWDMMGLGRFLGERAMLRLREREIRENRRWVGSFSNLGAWPPAGAGPGAPEADCEAWLFCPPVTTSTPFGSGAVIWRGRLALTLQLHPALGRKPADAGFWLGKWKENLHASLARRGAGRPGAGAFSGGDRGPQRLENQI